MIAHHLGGLPIEETLLPLLSGVSVGLLARTWVTARFRRGSPDPVSRAR